MVTIIAVPNSILRGRYMPSAGRADRHPLLLMGKTGVPHISACESIHHGDP